MIVWLAAAHAATPADCHVYLHGEELVTRADPEGGAFGVADAGGLALVRATDPDATELGFGWEAFNVAVDSAMRDRTSSYDVVVVVHTGELADQFDAASAFHATWDNADVSGIGDNYTVDADTPIRAALWMNQVDYWTDPVYSGWVFAQELGHQWLAFVDFRDDAGVVSHELLDEGQAHWSWFLDTGNSPMNGNAWIDHGDGTFSTDPTRAPSFSPLDLYLMGLIDADDVPPFFYVDDADGYGRHRGSTPEFLLGDAPFTVSGTRVDVGIEQIIDVEGVRRPGPGDAQTHFRLLPAFVLAPGEVVDDATIDAVWARLDEWATAWADMTGDRSSVEFVVDDGRELPPLPTSPAAVPEAAW